MAAYGGSRRRCCCSDSGAETSPGQVIGKESEKTIAVWCSRAFRPDGLAFSSCRPLVGYGRPLSFAFPTGKEVRVNCLKSSYSSLIN